MREFISPRSAQAAARAVLKPGWSFDVVRKTVFNRDRTADVVFGVKFFDRNGLPSGVLR